MRFVLALTAVLAIVVSLSATARCEEAPGELRSQEVRDAVERSLAYLETAGVAWIDNRKCVSCHRVAFLTWSVAQAGRRGFAVDRGKLDGWIDWSLQKSLDKPEKGEPDAAKNVDGVAQMILSRGAAYGDDRRNKDLETLVAILVSKQQKDASWTPAGQLPGQKRPKAETTQVTTMWIALALGSLDAPAAEATESRARALTWLKDAQPGKSTEWHAAWLLLKQQEKDEAAVALATERLRALQRADGGWGWIIADPSDALATGQALYALLQAGVPSDDPTIRTGAKFLLATQEKDGSWAVKGTKENKKNAIEETASYWGAGWATLALLETIPVAGE